MPRLTIDDATFSDLDALEALEAASFTSDRLARRSLRRLIGSASAVCRVARIDDRIIGYHLVLFRQRAAAGRLYSIAIAVDHQGAGMAAKLIADAEDQSRRRGRTMLRLEVREDNHRAIRLYQRLGYRQFDRILDYYADGAGALRFERSLDQS